MFFGGWYALSRVLIVGVCSYAALVLLLRIAGKRTLAKFNAFDFVITIALGSTLATVILSKDIALADGVLALALLVLLQFIVTWSAVRSRFVQRLVKSEPRLLLYRGQFLREAMHAERVTESEVLAGVRDQGFASLEQVQAVVLETDGTLAAIGNTHQPETALRTGVTDLKPQ